MPICSIDHRLPHYIGESCDSTSGFDDGHQRSYGCTYIHAFVKEVAKLFENTQKDAIKLLKNDAARHESVIDGLEAEVKRLVQKYFGDDGSNVTLFQ